MRVFTSVTARQEHLRRSLPTSLPPLNLTWLTLLLHLSVPLAWMSTLTHEHTHTTLSRPSPPPLRSIQDVPFSFLLRVLQSAGPACAYTQSHACARRRDIDASPSFDAPLSVLLYLCVCNRRWLGVAEEVCPQCECSVDSLTHTEQAPLLARTRPRAGGIHAWIYGFLCRHLCQAVVPVAVHTLCTCVCTHEPLFSPPPFRFLDDPYSPFSGCLVVASLPLSCRVCAPHL